MSVPLTAALVPPPPPARLPRRSVSGGTAGPQTVVLPPTRSEASSHCVSPRSQSVAGAMDAESSFHTAEPEGSILPLAVVSQEQQQQSVDIDMVIHTALSSTIAGVDAVDEGTISTQKSATPESAALVESPEAVEETAPDAQHETPQRQRLGCDLSVATDSQVKLSKSGAKASSSVRPSPYRHTIASAARGRPPLHTPQKDHSDSAEVQESNTPNPMTTSPVPKQPALEKSKPRKATSATSSVSSSRRHWYADPTTSSMVHHVDESVPPIVPPGPPTEVAALAAMTARERVLLEAKCKHEQVVFAAAAAAVAAAGSPERSASQSPGASRRAASGSILASPMDEGQPLRASTPRAAASTSGQEQALRRHMHAAENRLRAIMDHEKTQARLAAAAVRKMELTEQAMRARSPSSGTRGEGRSKSPSASAQFVSSWAKAPSDRNQFLRWSGGSTFPPFVVTSKYTERAPPVGTYGSSTSISITPAVAAVVRSKGPSWSSLATSSASLRRSKKSAAPQPPCEDSENIARAASPLAGSNEAE